MNRLTNTSFTSLFLILIFTTTQSIAQNSDQVDLSLGTIDFPTSAEGEAQQEFLTGVLALHSFWYPEARDHFQRARELDPDFAMAYWGEAMTHDHPIWEQHDQAAGHNVLEAMNQQPSLKWNEREKAYINAIKKLYAPDTEMGQRREQYAEAMQSLHEKYPEDDEALAFSALADMSVPSFEYSNPDVRDVVPIAAKLEDLYQRNPDHPGAMHYLIHVYDSDKFAELGLRPANDYADVAYSSSHAIHMPSHIYRQLEKWDQVIESNIRAWEASVKWQQRTGRPIRDRDYHSYRWLFEAYLAVDNFEKACSIIQNMRQLNTEAQSTTQDAGRIPSLIANFENQYKQNGGHSTLQCQAES